MQKGIQEGRYQYFAFISYKREDEKWAKWLQRKLENYRLPSSISKSTGFPRRLRPIFRDKTDIQPNILRDEITEQLDASRYLIVICSPKSAQSKWVGFGIDHFVATGKRDKIIAFIVEGEPYSKNEKTECYHPHLKQFFPRSENPREDKQLLGVNVHEVGTESKFRKRERASIQVISRMLGISFDSLWRRQKRQILKRLLLGLMLFAIIVSFSLWGISKYYISASPFTASFAFFENSPNDSLPQFENAYIAVIADGIQCDGRVSNIDDQFRLNNVPNSLAGTVAHIHLTCKGYKSIDTNLRLNSLQRLEVVRDSHIYGDVCATLIDVDTDTPLTNVEIQVGPNIVRTNESGFFRTHIPLRNQKMEYSLRSNDVLLETNVIAVPCVGFEVVYARCKK